MTKQRKKMNEVRLIDANTVDVSQIVKECIRDAVQTTLDNTPTADAKLIVHAHWMDCAITGIKCSNCNFPLWVDDKTIHKLAYCPHCGARMDENEYTLKYADEDTMMSAT